MICNINEDARIISKDDSHTLQMRKFNKNKQEFYWDVVSYPKDLDRGIERGLELLAEKGTETTNLTCLWSWYLEAKKEAVKAYVEKLK